MPLSATALKLFQTLWASVWHAHRLRLHWCRWRFAVQELGGGHMVSVGRAPPDAIVDAWGVRFHDCASPIAPRSMRWLRGLLICVSS